MRVQNNDMLSHVRRIFCQNFSAKEQLNTYVAYSLMDALIVSVCVLNFPLMCVGMDSVLELLSSSSWIV